MRRFVYVFIATLWLGAGSALAQGVTVTGTVADAADGAPLPLANIQIKGTSTGTVTDDLGRFSLSVPGPDAVLVFFYTGFQTQEITVGNQTELTVRLVSENEEIEQVVVTGYGTTTKKAFTGAAAAVTDAAMKDRISANAVNLLEGNVPGVQINTSTGQPGAPTTIFVRGQNSLNSGTQPLYVIDGVPIETSGALGMRSAEGASYSPLASLNPNDIASWTVLKDATATSIYGARAANGVIVITTKTGRQGSTRINFSTRLGVEMMPFLPRNWRSVNAQEFSELMNEAVAGSLELGGNAQYLTAGVPPIYSIYNDLLGHQLMPSWESTNTAWIKEITRLGFIQDYNLDISSGGETATSARHFFSIGFMDNKAYMKGKDLRRYSLRYNLSQQPFTFLEYGTNLSLSRTEINLGVSGGYFSDPLTQAYMLPPIESVYNPDGTYNTNTLTGYNPVALRSEQGDQHRTILHQAVLAPYLTFFIVPGLTFTTRVGVNYLHDNDFGTWSVLYNPQGKDMGGMGEMGNTDRFTNTWTNTLNYVATFNEVHNVNFLLGYEAQRIFNRSEYLSGTGYPVDYLYDISLTAKPTSASMNRSAFSMQSIFANAQYDYAGRYFASASVRFDGSSRFAKDKYWAPFWSVGAKWRIAEEAFMEPIREIVTDLTLRASYGTSGNQQVGPGWYASRGLLGGGYKYNGYAGMYFEQPANPNLTWEYTSKVNVGLDFDLLSRLSLSVDWYYHLTEAMVFDVPIPSATGLSSISQNLGALSNMGVELTLRAKALALENFQWDLTLIGSHNQNRIVRLNSDQPIKGASTIRMVGHDINTFYMIKWAGVDPQTGQGTWYDGDGQVTAEYPGTDPKAKQIVGQATPKFVGSLSSDFRFYGFDFSFMLTTALGGQIVGDNLRYDENTGSALGKNTTYWVYDNRWKKPGDQALVPRMHLADLNDNSMSTRYLMPGDYLKFKSITLGYTLPDTWIKSMKMRSFRIYATVENLYTITHRNYRGPDPSTVDPSGFQWWNYPAPLTVVGGLSVSF